MNRPSIIKPLIVSVGAVVAYQLLLVLLQNALCCFGGDLQTAKAVSCCIACPFCLIAFRMTYGSVTQPRMGPLFWLVAIAGTIFIALVSTGVTRYFEPDVIYGVSLINVLGFGLAAPIAEEALYRGVVLSCVEEASSPVLAIVLSSVLFAVAHVQPVQMVLALAFGLFLGVLFWKCRSLPAVAALHVLANMLAFAIP